MSLSGSQHELFWQKERFHHWEGIQRIRMRKGDRMIECLIAYIHGCQTAHFTKSAKTKTSPGEKNLQKFRRWSWPASN